MYLSRTQIKIVTAVHKKGTLESREIDKHLDFIQPEKRYSMITELVDKGVINYFFIIGSHTEHSSYNPTTYGVKVANNGYLKHNLFSGISYLNKHKEWTMFILGTIITIILAVVYSK